MLQQKNERETLHQTAETQEDSGGGVQYTTARQWVHNIRERFRRENATFTIAAACQMTSQIAHIKSSHCGTHGGNHITVPPAETLGASS
jgi:hypothetical protein